MERWKINLYTIWFSQILSLASFGFGIPFLPFYLQELGVVEPDKLKILVSIVGAAPAVTMAVMSPIWGLAADKWGRKLMLLRAMFFASLIIGGMGLVSTPEQLIALRLVQGLFTGTITAANALVASGTPQERKSFALGFLSSSTFIGMTLGPTIGGLVAEHFGYRISFYIGAALMFLDFFLVLFLVKEQEHPRTVAVKTRTEKPPLMAIFTPVVVSMLILLCLTRISRTVFNPYLPLFIQELNGKIEGAARITGLISGITGLMTALSGLVLSQLGDRYRKSKLLFVLLTLGIVTALPLVGCHNLWLFGVVLSIFCFVTGGIEPLIMSVTSESISPDRQGLLFGLQGLVGSIGWAVAPVIGSAISIQYSLQAVIWVIPLFLLLSLGTVGWVRRREQREIVTECPLKEVM